MKFISHWYLNILGYPEEGVGNIKAVCIEQDGTWKAVAHNTKRSMICEFIGMCMCSFKLSALSPVFET